MSADTVTSKWLPKAAVDAASTVPAYALVIVNLIIVLAVTTQAPLAAAIAVDVTVVLLSVYAIWAIELRTKRSVATDTPAQAERVAELRDLDSPIRTVFEGLVDNEVDAYVVYSSTEVREFLDQLGDTVRPDDPSYGTSVEKRVTTVPDARGASMLHNLLYLGGKRSRLRSITSWPDDFRPEYWEEANLILIGSGKSNCVTPVALSDFDAPFRFTERNDAIINATSPDERWPRDAEDLKSFDYGIVAKFKAERDGRTSVCFVIAGLGPYGTLAGCRFLATNIQQVCEEYATSPFAYLVSIKRGHLGSFEPKVERQFPPPVVRR